MRLSTRPGTLIAAGLALLAPALALAASEGEAFAVSADVKRVVLSMPAFLLGIGLHEWAHAWVAWRLGDSTPEEEGRLSLNPLDHLDPLGTLLIIGATVWHLPLLGWGKPVSIRPGAFRNPIKDKMKVALAGPMMNLAVVGVALLVHHGLSALHDPILEHLGYVFWSNVQILLQTLILTNASLALFNMLPIAPLDGSKVLENFVGSRTVITMRELEPYGIIILYGLINTPLLRYPFDAMNDGTEAMKASLAWAVIFATFVASAWFQMVRSLRLR